MADPVSAAGPVPFPARGARRAELDQPVAAFLVEESAALDEGRYQQWLDLLDQDFLYQIPVPLLREDPALPRHSETAVLFEATKKILELKLRRVSLPHAWSDRPGATTRHFLGAIRVFDLARPDAVRADCNVLVTTNRGWSTARWSPLPGRTSSSRQPPRDTGYCAGACCSMSRWPPMSNCRSSSEPAHADREKTLS
jgi:3-phenylpropionate/cinnamic acid dioxygenase small subunit